MNIMTTKTTTETYDNPWLFKEEIFTSDMIEDNYGFVYLIENPKNNRKYIGKKFFWNKKILPKTKTRRRRKHIKVESDWKEYYGSSMELKEILH